MLDEQMPQGFLMALGRNTRAMARFAYLSDREKEAVISRARMVRSKREMDELVDLL